MNQIPLIMDCDPGLDDAIAILLALAHPKAFNLLGITTVVGNGPLKQTHENARRICELAGRTDINVFAGCPRPLFPKPVSDSNYTGADIHGETGLGGCKLPSPTMPLHSMHGVSFIRKAILESSEKVTISASGPLTNLACALIMDPSLKDNIEKIVLMGGVIGLGNITPSAEYNFYCDPQAASVVFKSSIPLVMIGLDATRQTQTSPSWLKTIEAMGTPVSRAVVDMLSYYHRPDALLEPGVSGGVLHDPNIIAYLLKPELYKGREVYVEIDVSPTITAGRSTVDWYGKLGFPPNAYVIDQVDTDGFFALLTEGLGQYASTEKRGHRCSHC